MDDVVTFDRHLGRAARARAVDAAGAELTEILEHIAERRIRRARPSIGDDTSGGEPEAPDAVGAPSPDEVWTVEPVAPSVRILRVGRPADLDFRAGQHVKIGVPGRRNGSFSIASAPHEHHLEFCVELIPDGRLTPALFALSPGDRVELADRAKGDFALDASVTCHLMVATVTGIAPLRSMLRDALHRGVNADFIVLHGASHTDELPYLGELRALAASEARVRYIPTVSRPSAPRNVGWRGNVGRVDELACRVAAGLHPAGTRVYACGNSAMVRRVVAELATMGFEVSTETFD